MNTRIVKGLQKYVARIQNELETAIQEKNQRDQVKHRIRLDHVKRALRYVEKYPHTITLDNMDETELKKNMKEKVREILTDEAHDDISVNDEQRLKALEKLKQVHGIGDVMANKLIDEHNIRSIKDLKQAIQHNKIKVNDNVLIGLKYVNTANEKIPRSEITSTVKYLSKRVSAWNPHFTIHACGSYRRGRAYSGDLDLLVTHDQYKREGQTNYLPSLIDYLKHELNYIVDDLTEHMTMFFRGYGQYKSFPPRRVDIHFVPSISLPTALLYFTGPMELNRYMRSKAIQQNMMLSQYGLFKKPDDKRVRINTEKDVFDILNIPYLTPTQRESFADK